MKRSMNTGVVVIACLLVLGLAAQGAFAQEQDEGQRTGTKAQQEQSLKSGIVRISELMDKTLESRQGDDLGKIKDVVISDGQPRYILVSRGGALGLGLIGAELVPIPFQTISSANIQEDAIVAQNLDKQKLDQAPSFKENEWSQLQDPSFQDQVFGYYGEQPPEQDMQQEKRMMDQREMEEPGTREESQEPTTGTEETQPGMGTGERESGMGTGSGGGSSSGGAGGGM